MTENVSTGKLNLAQSNPTLKSFSIERLVHSIPVRSSYDRFERDKDFTYVGAGPRDMDCIETIAAENSAIFGMIALHFTGYKKLSC